MSEATARASLTYVDIMQSWLAASRQMIDLWRTGVREQQDSLIAAWRRQVVTTLADDLAESENTRTRATRH